MTNAEFSDAFSTMLNSYNTQMQFGEQASKAEIVLDEYEKSVFLTQAQDIIVKSYFDARLNAEGMGLDDGTKRQLDFSSLIRVANLTPYNDQTNNYDSRGILYQMPVGADESSPQALFILNEKLVNTHTGYKNIGNWPLPKTLGPYIGDSYTIISGKGEVINKSKYTLNITYNYNFVSTGTSYTTYTTSIDELENSVNVAVMHTEKVEDTSVDNIKTAFKINDELFDLDVSLNITNPYNSKEMDIDMGTYESSEIPLNGKEYVIVPISYKEYDRMMSRPYSQPLKKQAWRLFQNQVTGFDVQTELIPKFNVVEKDTATEKSEFIYKIRYVQRPTPIVLEDLPDGLTIDGTSTETPCSLNPVLHQDILNKAVELAIATHGGTPAATQARQARRQEKE